MTVYKIINPSDPYHLTADDLVLAAIAACLLGHGKYALEATDGSEGVPLFLFGGHDEWFAAQGAGSFDEALTAATGQRAEALAKVLESVTIVGTRSSLNDIGEAAARLAVGVRKMVAQAHERTPYDAMGPVDAPNPPAVRASLADVQPGGMVRLGDALPPLPEFGINTANHASVRVQGFTAEQMQNYARAALSAQPSPGGQGDAPPCWWIDHGTYGQITQRQDEADAAVNVGKRVVSYVARQPVGEPVAWMTQHDEPMLFPTAAEAADYCEDDEQPVPLFRSPAQAVDLPYSLDSDPAGIRARVADVITGTLMVGAQGHTPPPAGHWAEPFWNAARADAAAQAVDLDELRRAVCVVNVVGQIDGHDVVRRNSLLDVIDDRRQRLTESQAVQP